MSADTTNLLTTVFDTINTHQYFDHIALQDEFRVLNYQKFFHAIVVLAEDVKRRKLKPKDFVLCALTHSIESILIFFALIYNGYIPCLINTEINDNTFQDLISSVKVKGFLCDRQNANRLHMPDGLRCINVQDFHWDKILHSKDQLYSFTPNDDNSIAFSMLTSGTTGKSSLIVHKHQDPVHMNRYYGAEVLQTTAQDRILSTSKLFFAYGLSAIFFALLNGASYFITGQDSQPENYWDYIKKYQPTLFFSIPTVLKRMLLCSQASHINISFMRRCISAGEHLPVQIIKKWKCFYNKIILDGIGTSEILSTFISNRVHHYKLGSTGYAVPGFQLEIRKDNNIPAKTHEIGQLWVKGHTYVDYYLNNPTLSARRFKEKWFNTQDLFSLDEEGFYHYHGRASDLIKVSGMWVYPYAVEAKLNDHQAVYESAVVGEIQSDGLVRTKAFVVLNKGFQLSQGLIQELQYWCRQQGASHEYPHFICSIHALPKTATGKIKRYLLAEKNSSIKLPM